MKRRPPISTRTDTPFPYTTLFRSPPSAASAAVGRHSIPEVRRRRLGCQHRDRLGERHDALAVLAEGADRDSALLRLALADDEQVRNLGDAVLAHLIVDLPLSPVALEPDARRLKLRTPDALRV